MAITVADAGSLGRSSASPGTSASFAFDCGATFAQWDMVVVAIACDNAGTGGVSSISSVTDAGGNTYTKRQEQTKTFGSANDGSTCSIWTAVVGAGGLASTDDITISVSPNTTRCAALVWKVTPTTGYEIGYVTGEAHYRGDGTYSGLTGHESGSQLTTTSITSGNVVFCAMSAERRTNPTGVESDTTNGSWVPSADSRDAEDSDTSTENGSMMVSANYKITTGTGTQAWRCNHSATVDWASVYIVLTETIRTTSVAIDLATETDTAFDLGTGTKTYSLDLATETDTAFDVTTVKVVSIELAEETDTAFDVTVTLIGGIEQAQETDTAFDVTVTKIYTIEQAVDTHEAFDFTVTKTYTLDLATETDEAQTVTTSKTYSIELAEETDTAFDVTLFVIKFACGHVETIIAVSSALTLTTQATAALVNMAQVEAAKALTTQVSAAITSSSQADGLPEIEPC